MIKNKEMFLMMLLTSFICLFNGSTVFAEGSDYVVIPILSENQREETKSFYDIDLKDNKTINLSFSIENISNKTKKFSIAGFDTATNSNGILDYSNAELKENVDKKMRLTNYIKLPDTFSVEPGETKKISFTISPSNHDFEGYILGAIQIIPEVEEKSGITNQFTRTIAIRLWGSNTVEKNKSSIVTLPKEFRVDNDKERIIYHTIKNESPNIEKDVSVETHLQHKIDGRNETIIKDEHKIDFAPSSKFKMGQNLSDSLEDGEYLFEVITKVEGKQLETYSYEFSITNGNIDGNSKLVGILFVLVIIVGLIYIYLRKRMNTNESKKDR